MSGLINFIKGIFSAIFGVFGGKKDGATKAKKSKGYFLELDDTKGQEAAAPAATTAAPAANPAPAAATAAPKASPRQEKLAALANNAASAAAPAPAAPAPAPAPVAPKKPVPTEVNFATKYLVPENTTARRRPGANMTSYLSMARQVKAS